MPVDPQTRLLTQAARRALQPMGLVQKGRSRTWLDDHDAWLIVVEFQPTSSGKGSYLNVGICWLWDVEPKDHLSFDLGHRVQGAPGQGLELYESEQQWTPIAEALAQRAAREVRAYRSRVPDLRGAAAVLAEQRADGTAGWPLWHGAIASGLVGDVTTARQVFAQIAASNDDRDWWLAVKERARVLGPLLETDPDAFRAEIGRSVDANRRALRLPSAELGWA